MTAAPAPEPAGDADLLRRVAGRDEDPQSARDAEGLFYERHVRYLYGVLMRRRELVRLAHETPEDLVQETFRRAFDKAHTFDTGGLSDPERLRRRTRAWLGRIAQNLIADALDRPREVSATDYLDRVGADETEPASSRSPKLALVHAALERLTEREQDVLRVSALYHRPGERHQRLPNAVSAELAERWDTTNENIRAIRSRALKKVAAYVAREELTGDSTRE